MIKYHKRMLCAVIFLFVMVLTGCGASKKNTSMEQGMTLIKQTDYQGALASFEQALKSGEDELLTYRGLGLAYMGMIQYDKAIESFSKSLSYSSGSISQIEYDINYYLATAYYKAGQTENALKTYNAILALRPEEKDAHYLRGVIQLESGLVEEGKEDFNKAVSYDKSGCQMAIDVYQVMKENGYEEDGLTYLNQVMEKKAKTLSDFDKGRICYYLGDLENACLYLDKANKDKNNEATTLFLGRAYEATGDTNFASSIYTNFLVNHEDSEAVYNQLGVCKLSLGDYQAALEAFEKAMQIENCSILQTLKYNEIVAYEYLGDYKKATVLMETYLGSYPDDKKALREYDFLKTR